MVFIGDVLYRGEILDLSVENPDVSGDYTACPDSFYRGYIFFAIGMPLA
jgi:hypothetical protein